jgi:hypothetical protein
MHGIALLALIALIISKFCLLAIGRVTAAQLRSPIMGGIALVGLIFSKYLENIWW